jgi:hypothetical protein
MTDGPRTGVLPTHRQLSYLRYLLSQAHRTGLPYVPIWAFSRANADAWINYLQDVLRAQEAIDAALAPYLKTPPRDKLPDGYRPPWDASPPAFDHEHSIDTWETEDGHDVVYCTLCSAQW